MIRVSGHRVGVRRTVQGVDCTSTESAQVGEDIRAVLAGGPGQGSVISNGAPIVWRRDEAFLGREQFDGAFDLGDVGDTRAVAALADKSADGRVGYCSEDCQDRYDDEKFDERECD